ncbi:hypothetical protein ACFV16_22255 [Streptomyces massasporeus]|uniref:hypothetical protein n=1 Tax=Streptomyces massasporeus TaxID=67324 RepID=UPI0036A1880C
MRAKTPEGQRLEAAARERLSRLTDEKLSVTWLLTEAMPMSEELAMTRGWLMDELESRMGEEKFDAWMWTDGDAVDPYPFLAD